MDTATALATVAARFPKYSASVPRTVAVGTVYLVGFESTVVPWNLSGGLLYEVIAEYTTRSRAAAPETEYNFYTAGSDLVYFTSARAVAPADQGIRETEFSVTMRFVQEAA